MSMPVFQAAATKASVSQISRSCLVKTVMSPPSLSVVTSRGVSEFATRHGNDSEILERGKQKVMDQHRPDSKVEPAWQEEVASDSEAFVKAIRREVKGAGEDIETIVKESEKILKETRTREGHGNKS
ncbi:hypothetical protein BGX38DRAFT_1160965 [Terfezia claveryi]|nr:hypothetical protein BGX38DRAFT_1160965 [Terfezia claveryi]